MKKRLPTLRLLLAILLCSAVAFAAQKGVASQLLAYAGLESDADANVETVTTIAPAANVLLTEEIPSGLKLRYTFSEVNNKTVTDASGSGNNATLKNEASILVMGKYKVLSLGNGSGYLDMGKNAGSVISAMSNYTVSVYYRVDKTASLSGNGFFLWAFSSLEANSATSGPYVAYRLNAQRFALSTGGYNNEKGIEIGGASAKDGWMHIVYRQTGAKGELFLNGKSAGTNAAVPLNNATFSTAPAYNWIGRAPFSGDSYLKNTLVYDFSVYDQAVTNDQITEWAALTQDLDNEYMYGTAGNFKALTDYLVECKSLLGAAGAGDYPPMAIVEFQDVISLGQNLVTENKASQFAIDNCLAELKTANTKFKALKGVDTELPAMPEYNPEKGFKHPGALHTQEDFDRIKALLEAKDPTIVAAYNKLKANEYSQSGVATWPVERIVRGGGVGENYMNAARGATMAYQNALRWKISGDKAHAERAIYILNSWASICKAVGGDTNQSLASGLYGYEFANAAELMRDYEGWKPEDFATFKNWILTIWYPRCIDFLRRRHDTWSQGTPGHYWSNWGLCNALAVMTFGILCDDVFIYNQGASFYKHDQVGSFTDNRTAPIDNNGLTEFIGNLVPAVHADARGPLGYLGQMQESGRDQGHALMALGLAVDIAQTGWNQGDDMFALMNNRLAAGVEYLAAYNKDPGLEDLPWTEYWYHDVRTAWHNSWKMGGNNGGGRGAFRPYWDRIIGHYEGIKGMTMTYSQAMKSKDPIDNGCGAYGVTSGGFDHLGFSTLTCYRPAVTADKAPTLITPTLIYKGVTYKQAELGGLANTFDGATGSGKTALPAGSVVKFVPLLPSGTINTGNWQWDTGETTKDLEITANESKLYRVTYTNDKGVKSTQLYSIAVKADCQPEVLTPEISANGVVTNDTIITIMPGTMLTLTAWSKSGWGSYLWNNGSTSHYVEVPNITSDRTYSVNYTNQGGRVTRVNFHIRVRFMYPSISVNGGAAQSVNTIVAKAGQSVELIPIVPSDSEGGEWEWSNGATTKTLLIQNIQASEKHSVTYTYKGQKYTMNFSVYLPLSGKVFEDGNYFIRNASDDRYLTNDGVTTIPSFAEKNAENIESQVWRIVKDGTRYKISSILDERFLNEQGQFATTTYSMSRNTYVLYGVKDGDLCAIQNSVTVGSNYWSINADGTLKGKGASSLSAYPFEILLAGYVSVDEVESDEVSVYPNPMLDYLVVTLKESEVYNATFILYTEDGIRVKSHTCTAGANTISVGELPAGRYIGVLNVNGTERAVKLLK